MTADCRYIETASICPNCGSNVWNKNEQVTGGLRLWRECEMCRSVFDENVAVTICSVRDSVGDVWYVVAPQAVTL